MVNIEKKEKLLLNQLETMAVKEIVTLPNQIREFDDILSSPFAHDNYNEKYDKIFSKINDLKQIKTASLLLNYLLDTQKRELEHLQIIEEINNEDYVTMDLYTKKL